MYASKVQKCTIKRLDRIINSTIPVNHNKLYVFEILHGQYLYDVIRKCTFIPNRSVDMH